jgi:hypothetical protein
MDDFPYVLPFKIKGKFRYLKDGCLLFSMLEMVIENMLACHLVNFSRHINIFDQVDTLILIGY